VAVVGVSDCLVNAATAPVALHLPDQVLAEVTAPQGDMAMDLFQTWADLADSLGEVVEHPL
jgi:hypothetical protein